MGSYRQKRIWVSPKFYVTVRLYDNKLDMQEYYKQKRPKDLNHNNVLGVHMVGISYRMEGRKCILHKESGIVLLNREHCGSGIVSHELMHACLWAFKLHRNKKQFPIIIRSMKDEEELLLNHTKAVATFYRWFWTIYEEVSRYETVINKKAP